MIAAMISMKIVSAIVIFLSLVVIDIANVHYFSYTPNLFITIFKL